MRRSDRAIAGDVSAFRVATTTDRCYANCSATMTNEHYRSYANCSPTNAHCRSYANCYATMTNERYRSYANCSPTNDRD